MYVSAGKELIKEVAVATQQTMCAPITAHNENKALDSSFVSVGGLLSETKPHHTSISEKLHGLTEKIHMLGHIGKHEGSGSSETGSYGRAGTNLFLGHSILLLPALLRATTKSLDNFEKHIHRTQCISLVFGCDNVSHITKDIGV